MDDIYSDLDNYERVNETENIKELNAELKYKIEAVTDELAQLRQDYDKLHTEYKKLQANYSALLKTAKAEIKRKTVMITNLNAEKDQLIFSYMSDSANRYSLPTKRNYKRHPENEPVNNIPGDEASSASLTCKEIQDTNLGLKRENVGDDSESRTAKETSNKDKHPDTKNVASNITNRRKSIPEARNTCKSSDFCSEDDYDAINKKKDVHENISSMFSEISSIDSFKPVDEHLFQKQHREEHRSRSPDDHLVGKKVEHEHKPNRLNEKPSRGLFKQVDEHLYEKRHREDRRSKSPDEVFIGNKVEHENIPNRFSGKSSRDSFEHENMPNRFSGKSSRDSFKQTNNPLREDSHREGLKTKSLGDGFSTKKNDLENKSSTYRKSSRDSFQRQHRARSSDKEFIVRKTELENRSKKQRRSRSPKDNRYNRSKYDSRDRHIKDRHRSREDSYNRKRWKDVSPTHKQPRNELSKEEYFKRCELERNRVLRSPPQETKLRYRSGDRYDRDRNTNDHHHDRDEHYERHEKHPEHFERRTSKHKLRDHDEVPATKRTRNDDEMRSIQNSNVISPSVEEKNIIRSPNSSLRSEEHSAHSHVNLPVIMDAEQIVDVKANQCPTCQDHSPNDALRALPIRAVDCTKYMSNKHRSEEHLAYSHVNLPVRVVDAEQIVDVKPNQCHQCHTCQDHSPNDALRALPIRAVDCTKYMSNKHRLNICQSPDEKSTDNPKIIPLERDFTIMTPKEIRLTDPRFSSNKYISVTDSSNKHILCTVISRNIEFEMVQYENDERENALKYPFDYSDGFTEEVYADIDAPIASVSFESGEITDNEQLVVNNVQPELNRIEISLSGERIEEPIHTSEQQENLISIDSDVEKTVRQDNYEIPKIEDKILPMNVNVPLRVSIQRKYFETADSRLSLQQNTVPVSTDSLIITNERKSINNDFNKDVESQNMESNILDNICMPVNINEMKVNELEEYQLVLCRQIVEDDLELSDDTADDGVFDKKKVSSKSVSKVKTLKTDKNKDNRSLRKSKVTKSNKKSARDPKKNSNELDVNLLENNVKGPKISELFGEESLMTSDDLSVTNSTQKLNTETHCVSLYQKQDDKISLHPNSLIESSEDFSKSDDNVKSTSTNRIDNKGDTSESNFSSNSDSKNKKIHKRSDENIKSTSTNNIDSKDETIQTNLSGNIDSKNNKKVRKRRITKIQSINDSEPVSTAQLPLVTESDATTQETAQIAQPDYIQSNVVNNEECTQFTNGQIKGQAFATSTPMKGMENFDPKLAIYSNNSSFSQITPDPCPKMDSDSQSSNQTQSVNVEHEVPDVRIFVRRKRATHKKSSGT